MKISRKGSSADHGTKYIELNDARITWNNEHHILQFRKQRIKDFVSDATHDYTVDISLSEIRTMLKVIGDKPVSEVPDILSNELSPCLREIIRIQQACVGKI